MPKGPIALIILDGWGHDTANEHNAITQAKTPNWDRIEEKYSKTLLSASGKDVGLPENQMGNSEVGHMVIGSGRVIHQDLTRISNSIDDGSFFENTTLTDAISKANKLHILGLVSPGGIHSHENHLKNAISLCKNLGQDNVYIHAFLDGRDTPPQSAADSLEKIYSFLSNSKSGKIVSISGRFYSMDRDKRYERTEKAYDLLTQGISDFSAKTPQQALKDAYLRGETDEFVIPTIIDGFEPISDGDTVLFFNFRADRARQLSFALTEPNFDGFIRKSMPKIKEFITFTEYAKELNCKVAFPKPTLKNIFGQICSEKKLTQLRVAETEKYAHVTFFFNGGTEKPFEGESRTLIPSPKVSTYDIKPEMGSYEICEEIVQAIDNNKYDVIIANFANADMVGHTGNMSAAIEAIEHLDKCLGKIEKAIINSGGCAFITADHGNADCMYNTESKQAHTAHTKSLVPFVLISKNKNHELLPANGTLADIAPTLLDIMGIGIAPEMTGKSLLKE